MRPRVDVAIGDGAVDHGERIAEQWLVIPADVGLWRIEERATGLCRSQQVVDVAIDLRSVVRARFAGAVKEKNQRGETFGFAA